jgi:TDG/mug DNA glycosylase family protein
MQKQNANSDAVGASEGFPPIARADARVLILGSLPGQASLRAQEYYAHPRNAFWTLMKTIAGADGDYGARCEALKAHGIAVWDVLSSSVRPGSLDADIDLATARPNDFGRFFAGHVDIRLVCFNGRKAEAMFRKLVQPTVPQASFETALLPSTSPAHASLSVAEKLATWRGIIEPHAGGGQR